MQYAPSWREADEFARLGFSSDDATLFAAFLFRKRCPEFAAGLRSESGAAMAALAGVVETWSRGPGAPKRGQGGARKWDACDALMKAVGLPGATIDALKADWKEWQQRQAMRRVAPVDWDAIHAARKEYAKKMGR